MTRVIDVLFFVLLGSIAVCPVISFLPFPARIGIALLLLIGSSFLGLYIFSRRNIQTCEIKTAIDLAKANEIVRRYRTFLLHHAYDEPLTKLGTRQFTQLEEAMVSELIWAIMNGCIEQSSLNVFISKRNINSLIHAIKEQGGPSNGASNHDLSTSTEKEPADAFDEYAGL